MRISLSDPFSDDFGHSEQQSQNVKGKKKKTHWGLDCSHVVAIDQDYKLDQFQNFWSVWIIDKH